RPEIDEPDRLDPLRAHVVELADPLRLALEIAVELLEACAPGTHVGFELPLLLVTEVESEVLETGLVLSELFAHALTLLLEGLTQVLLLPLPAPPELVDRDRRQFFGARLELGQELFDIAGSRVEELALDRLAGHAAVRFAERAL